MIKILSLFFLIDSLFSLTSLGQSPIDVTESTLKVPGLEEEIFYYGFAEGDKLIFSFQEIKGKELKEIEITEFQASSIFMDYKASKIESKTIDIKRTAIYKFRFANAALGGRICRIKIQRLPASPSTLNFNPNVYWKTINDTIRYQTQERYLEKTDTTVINLVDQVAKVSSQNAINGNRNRTVVDFLLPEHTIAWSYYIGVGSEGKAAYESAKNDFLNSTASTLSTIPEYGLLASLALSGLSTFNKVQGRDNVKYWLITDWDNVLLFNSGNTFAIYKQGDVVNDAAQMKSPLSGKVYIGLLNDNLMEPIEVIVKATAIQIFQHWNTRMVDKVDIQSHQEPYLK